MLRTWILNAAEKEGTSVREAAYAIMHKRRIKSECDTLKKSAQKKLIANIKLRRQNRVLSQGRKSSREAIGVWIAIHRKYKEPVKKTCYRIRHDGRFARWYRSRDKWAKYFTPGEYVKLFRSGIKTEGAAVKEASCGRESLKKWGFTMYGKLWQVQEMQYFGSRIAYRDSHSLMRGFG